MCAWWRGGTEWVEGLRDIVETVMEIVVARGFARRRGDWRGWYWEGKRGKGRATEGSEDAEKRLKRTYHAGA